MGLLAMALTSLAGCASDERPRDAAALVDAVVTPLDAGSTEIDAGEPPLDAGTFPLDGSLGEDAAVPIDAAIGLDATPTLDAGAPADSSTRRDSGPPPPDAGPLPGCRPELLFCDDFESGVLAPARWQSLRARGGAAMDVSSSRHFEGTHAMRIRIPGGGVEEGRGATASPQGVFLAPAIRFFGRFYVLSSDPGRTVHNHLFNAAGAITGHYWGLHCNGSGASGCRFNTRYSGPGVEMHGGLRMTGDTQLPIERWRCVEFMFDGAHDEATVWIDGVEDAGMRVVESDGWIAPTFTRLDIGFHAYQVAERDFTVWYDLVAFDDERIGCI